jgi:hypothetical protein
MHRDVQQLSVNDIKHLIAGRDLYLWGAGNQGRGMARVLIQNSIGPVGYIDRSPDLTGKTIGRIKVERPNILKNTSKNIFVIITTFFYEQDIASILKSYGLKHGTDFIHYSQLKPRDYSIDISGTCNLRCLSCARASFGRRASSPGMMSLESFKQVIDKIKREDPFVGNIQLYQWGEPTLNRKLPEMIRYAAGENILSAVSSNLNADADYERIVESKPEWFRVSASGWGKAYEIAHTGGDWETFLKNFVKVAELKQSVHPDMKLELYYHVYTHSTGKGFAMFRNLCQKLGVEFHPVYAYLISLDDVLNYIEGVPLPPNANTINKNILLDLEKGLEIAKRECDMPCDTFRCIHINSDLSVSNCMMYFHPEGNRAVSNFLEHDTDSIMDRRKTCLLCKRCLKHGIHRYCGAYSTYKLNMNVLGRDG